MLEANEKKHTTAEIIVIATLFLDLPIVVSFLTLFSPLIFQGKARDNEIFTSGKVYSSTKA
jgi:hypothetical protein